VATIAVDAMGGDHAPGPEVEGAIAAVRERLAEVVLVGDEARLRELVGKHGGLKPGLTIRHATQVITMEDHPSVAAKSKKDSSMRVAFDLAKKGEAQAVVSAGNSGAFMACGLFVMKRTAGVDRPAVLTTFPTRGGQNNNNRCALLDMGLNVECRPATLAQFAAMGSVFARLRHGKARPRVGLLSNGEEATKGTELTRGAHKLLSASGEKEFEYLGYIEGRDIFSGKIDVVVTDGFTGNVVLKTAEGVGQFVFDVLREEVLATAIGKLGASLLRGAFTRLKKRVDYAEEGGAPLVGVDGVAVLCHGASNAKAIKNAVRVAAQLVDGGLPQAVAQSIRKHEALFGSEIAPTNHGAHEGR
jgi:glycerol-3-phosphate acyltransferase PlsX